MFYGNRRYFNFLFGHNCLHTYIFLYRFVANEWQSTGDIEFRTNGVILNELKLLMYKDEDKHPFNQINVFIKG